MMLCFFLHEMDRIELMTGPSFFQSFHGTLRHTHIPAHRVIDMLISIQMLAHVQDVYKRIQTHVITVYMHTQQMYIQTDAHIANHSVLQIWPDRAHFHVSFIR